jgi:O-antigen ligase
MNLVPTSPKEKINQIFCIVLLFSSTLFPVRILPGNTRIDSLLIPIAACLLIFQNLNNWQTIWKTHRKILLTLAVFYGWIWVCAVFSPYLKTAIKYNIMYSINILIFLAFLLITFDNNPIDIYHKYHRIIFNFLALLGFIGIVEYFFPDNWFFDIFGAYDYLGHYPQVSSLMQNPNQFGTVMAIGLGLGMILKKERVIQNYEFYPGMFCLFMSLALAASRNGWIVFVLLIVLGLIYRILTLKEAIIYSAIFIFTLLFFPIPTYRLGLKGSEIFPLIDWLTQTQAEPGALIPDPQSTAMSRFLLWKTAIAQMVQHPITGIGIGVFAEHIGPQVMGRVGLHAHNLFLNIGAETGIPGLLIFLSLLGQIVLQATWKNGSVMIFVILLLVSQLPDFFIADFTFMMVALYFLAIACQQRGREGVGCRV